MSQPSSRSLRRPVLWALGFSVASVAMGSLVPSPVTAQAIGGMRRAGPANANAPSEGQTQAPQRFVPQTQAPQRFVPQAEPARVFAPAPLPFRRAEPAAPAPSPFRRAEPVYNGGEGDSAPSPFRRVSPGVRFPRPIPGGNAPVVQTYSNAPAPSGIRGMGDSVLRTLHSLPPQGGYQIGNDNAPSVGYSNRPTYPVTTPNGRRYLPPDSNNYVYGQPNGITVIHNGPSFLGGYYYSNYCDTAYDAYTYPSIYSSYWGFPRYIYNPGNIVILDSPYYPVYATAFLPFFPPSYQVTYNQNNYYVADEDHVSQIERGGERARQAVHQAYAADTYQAAFADIERAWNEGNVGLLRRHIRDNDTKLSVFLNSKYSYSIASGDFLQITRDALDRLQTTSFQFNRLRKARNGDVTAFGKHVYRAGDANSTSDGTTVPFDSNGDTSDSPYNRVNDPAAGEDKTIYVSYTLRHKDDQWYIIAVDSSADDLVSQRPSDMDETARAAALTRPVEAAPEPQALAARLPAPAPQIAAAPAIVNSKVYLSVTRQGNYLLNGTRVARAQIVPTLRNRIKQNPRLTVALLYDRSLSMTRFQQAMALIKQANPAAILVANTPAPKVLAHKKLARQTAR